ncbi:hypothetical protein KAX17_01580 [Candidatus Bipolaricaulota bacterium]|nr:hypothetical protein [Candidatus Bipolaricaulota bacterium]
MAVSISGIQGNSVVKGIIPIECLVTGSPYDEYKIVVKSVDPDARVEQEFHNQSSFFLRCKDLDDGNYALIVQVFHANKPVRTLEVPFSVDKTGPMITLTGLTDAQVIAGVVQFEVVVSGEERETICDVTLDYSTPISANRLDTRLVSDGLHTLTVLVQDQAGNETKYEQSINIDNSPPEILSLGCPEAARGSIRLQPDINENNIKKVTWHVDKTFLSNDLSPEWPTEELHDGPHTLRLEVVDMFGTVIEKEVTVMVDNTVPILQSVLPEGTVVVAHATKPFDAANLYMRDFDIARYYVNGKLSPSRRTDLSSFETGDVVDVRVVIEDFAGNQKNFEHRVMVGRTFFSLLEHFVVDAIKMGHTLYCQLVDSILRGSGVMVVEFSISDTGEWSFLFGLGVGSPHSYAAWTFYKTRTESYSEASGYYLESLSSSAGSFVVPLRWESTQRTGYQNVFSLGVGLQSTQRENTTAAAGEDCPATIVLETEVGPYLDFSIGLVYVDEYGYLNSTSGGLRFAAIERDLCSKDIDTANQSGSGTSSAYEPISTEQYSSTSAFLRVANQCSLGLTLVAAASFWVVLSISHQSSSS